MTTRIIAASVVLLMLAGCDQPPPEKKAADATDYVDRIATMPEGGRNAVFIRALRGAELDCQKVVHSVAAGSYQGMPLWAVTCRDSGPGGGPAQMRRGGAISPSRRSTCTADRRRLPRGRIRGPARWP